MAQDIRIMRNDSYDIEFEVKDSKGQLVSINFSGWKMMFESDYINKNSIDNPGDFTIEQGSYGTGQGRIVLNATETNPPDRKRVPYKIRLYKLINPTVVKTVASGDMFFIDEAY